jgi:sensor histidine kinase YesM
MVGCFMFIFIFLSVFYLFIFVLTLVAIFSVFGRYMPFREADPSDSPIIFLTDLQQLLKIEASLQNHQPQTKRATAGCQNRLS